jgi:hypothetical protein
VGVYFMSNSGAPSAIGEAALKLLRGEDYTPPPQPKIISVDPGVLDRYVGVYASSSYVAFFTVSRDGNKLMLQEVDAQNWIPVSDKMGFVVTTPHVFPMPMPDRQVLFLTSPAEGYFMVHTGNVWQRLVIQDPLKGPGASG